MIELYWNQPQLESEPPECLEEYSGYHKFSTLTTGDFVTKYQIWQVLEQELLPKTWNKYDVINFLLRKLNSEIAKAQNFVVDS